METFIRISRVLSTAKKIKMLQEILYGKVLSVSAVAKSTGTDKGSVSRYFSELVNAGVIKKEKRRGALNEKSAMVKGLRIMLNLAKLDLKPFEKSVTGIGLYGSRAKGTDNSESDFDVWVRVSRPVKEEKVAEFEHGMSNKLGAAVKVLVLDEARLQRLKKEDQVFYCALAFGSIILWGEGLENEI